MIQPRTLDRLFAAVVVMIAALSPAAPALAVTGSGTVHFSFTRFDGPVAQAERASLAHPPTLDFYLGRFNGVQATPDGGFIVTSDSPSHTEYGVATGFADFGPGTTSVTWTHGYNFPGTRGENILSFVPDAFSNKAVGELFRLGTLTHKNGQWNGAGTRPDLNVPSVFRFEISTSSLDGPQFNQSASGYINNVVHQNTSLPFAFRQTDPQAIDAEADWIFITQDLGSVRLNTPEGAFRVYDDQFRPPGFANIGSIELWGRFGSLELVELRNPQGGFFTGSVEPLGVPEPAQWAMLITGFGLIGAAARRRRGAVPA